MGKKKRKGKGRKKTLAQLRKELENVKVRNVLLLARALGKLNGKTMTKRNRKRLKDARKHWSKDWD